MKNLIKIYSRYILSACLLLLLLAAANFIFLAASVLHYTSYYEDGSSLGSMGSIAEEIVQQPMENNGFPFLSEEGIRLAEKSRYCFAFILSPSGDVVWQWEMPEEFPSRFSPGDVSAFSKWYLHDYPVKTRRYGDYLLVCGQPQHSTWKYSIEFPETFMKNLGFYFKCILIVNLILLASVLLVAGYRFYISLRPLAQGIDMLADGNTVSLPEKGLTSGLCGRLNQTSLILKEQKEALAQRDHARTEWISGVSHDIRTPLSMIMGYADSLASSTALSSGQQKEAEIIKQQSLVIKKLIEDLNLTSKLEYHMQPLRTGTFFLAPFLRSLAAAYLNEMSGKHCEITLNIPDHLEKIYMDGDQALLSRAMNNLIGNSIRHNPAGCHITISAILLNDHVCSVCIRDSGAGIPEQVIQALEEKTSASGTGRPPYYAPGIGTSAYYGPPHRKADRTLPSGQFLLQYGQTRHLHGTARHGKNYGRSGFLTFSCSVQPACFLSLEITFFFNAMNNITSAIVIKIWAIPAMPEREASTAFVSSAFFTCIIPLASIVTAIKGRAILYNT